MLFTKEVNAHQAIKVIEGDEWLFHKLTYGGQAVQVDEKVWLSAPDRITLGRLCNSPTTEEETDALVTMLRIRTGLDNNRWHGHCVDC